VTADPLAGLVLAGFHGTAADDPEPAALAAMGVRGFVVFGRNVESPEQVHALLGGLAAASAGPPLLAVDQEGGRVARLRAPLTVWPPMQALGARGDAATAEALGRALGDEIAAVGFNVVFAPVLDVRFEGTTIAIGDRALSDDPAVVAALGVALIDGLQGAGLAACAKHFPGHGHVTVDSHLALPTCPLSEEALRRDHLTPFARAVAGGVDSVMTAHVHYPAVDDAPATMSKRWIDGVLRTELGFSGVVFSDDLEMGAITAGAGIADAAVAAVRAGVDGLLVCSRRDAVADVVARLRAEADADPAFAARCAASLERLRALAGARPPRPVPLERLAAHVGVPAHQRLAASLGPAAAAADPTRAHLS
jgi:beta-N-acetylhexosaminidase